jgi:alkylation response protein AidB-like acyl-CoA dehydrogenase
MVQNGDIELTDVFVPEKNRLEKAKDFATGAGMILLHSRLCLAFMVCGIAAGAYEAALRYTM